MKTTMVLSILPDCSSQLKILETGNFKGEVKIIQSPNVMINSFSINRKVLQFGNDVPGFVTFAIWNPNTSFSWKRHEMNKGMIGVIWKNEHYSVTGSGFHGIPVSIEEKFLINLCKLKGYFELIDKLKKIEILQVNEADLIQIRNLSSYLIKNPDLSDRIVLELLEKNLVNLLIDSLAKALPEKSAIDLTHQKFSGMIDFIHDNLTHVTSVHQICEETGVPERTIRRLFMKKYGISPKRFLSALRLNEVRKLLKSSAEENYIIQVASEYNFWHMGQFSRDYKQLFNELPSETTRWS
jgi:AraC family ethanolamine operon transcriptional activator